MRGWVIDRDYLAQDADESIVGTGMTVEDAAETAASFDAVIGRSVSVRRGLKASDVEDAVRFRALDGDGEVYYGGAVTADWITGTDDEAQDAYSIDRFVEAMAGGTCIQFKASDLIAHGAEAMVARHREIGCTEIAGGTEWVIVYG